MKKRKMTFWLMLAIFISPILAANWLYRHADEFHLPTRNRGTLITPPEQAPALHLFDEQKTPLPEAHFEGSWWIMVLNEGACDDGCREQLHWLSQSFVALSKDKNRVKALVAIQAPDPTFEDWLHQSHPMVEVAYLESLPSFLNGTPGLILMDPHGNIMLRYTMDEDFNHCFKDLKWLLHNSQIG